MVGRESTIKLFAGMIVPRIYVLIFPKVSFICHSDISAVSSLSFIISIHSSSSSGPRGEGISSLIKIFVGYVGLGGFTGVLVADSACSAASFCELCGVEVAVGLGMDFVRSEKGFGREAAQVPTEALAEMVVKERAGDPR